MAQLKLRPFKTAPGRVFPQPVQAYRYAAATPGGDPAIQDGNDARLKGVLHPDHT